MCSRTRWGRIDPAIHVDLVQGAQTAQRVIQLDKGTLPRFVQQQLLLMASPVPFLNFLNKIRLDESRKNHHFKGVYPMRCAAKTTELAALKWRVMSNSDRKPYVQLARRAQGIQEARLMHFFGCDPLLPSTCLASRD